MKSKKETESKVNLTIDPKKILQLGKVEPRVPYMLSRTTVLDFILIKGSSRYTKYDESGQFEIDWAGSGAALLKMCRYVGYDSGHECLTYRLVAEHLELMLPK